MQFIRKNGSTSNIFRVKLRRSDTGQGLTGLTSASSGLIISTICDNENAATVYTVAGSTIETVTTIGTFSTPTTNKVRFREVDATNHPGLYEIQLANARFAVSSARLLRVNISGATTLLDKEVLIQLTSVDFDSAAAFMTGINGNTNVTANLKQWADNTVFIGSNSGLPQVDVQSVADETEGVSNLSNFAADYTTGATLRVGVQSVSSGVIVATNNDKTGYVLGATQVFNNTGQTTSQPDSEGVTTLVFESGVSQLSKVLASQIDSRIAGHNPNTDLALYSNVAAGTLNTTRWLDGVDLSPIGLVINGGGTQWNVTVIHPQIVYTAWHFGDLNGSTGVFRGSDGSLNTRTFGPRIRIGITDVAIYKLNSALPSTVAVAPVVDPNWFDKIGRGVGIPMVRVDQYRKAVVIESLAITNAEEVTFAAPSDPSRSNFYSLTLIGDSGGGLFVLYRDRLILAGSTHSYFQGAATSGNYAAINTAMNGQISGASLSTVDVSGYPDYVAPLGTPQDFSFSSVALMRATGTESATGWLVSSGTYHEALSDADDETLGFTGAYIYLPPATNGSLVLQFDPLPANTVNLLVMFRGDWGSTGDAVYLTTTIRVNGVVVGTPFSIPSPEPGVLSSMIHTTYLNEGVWSEGDSVTVELTLNDEADGWMPQNAIVNELRLMAVTTTNLASESTLGTTLMKVIQIQDTLNDVGADLDTNGTKLDNIKLVTDKLGLMVEEVTADVYRFTAQSLSGIESSGGSKTIVQRGTTVVQR